MARWRGLSILLGVLLMAWLSLGHPSAAPGGPPAEDLSRSVLPDLPKPPSKIDSALYGLWQAAQDGGRVSAQALAQGSALDMARGRVQVVVEAVDGQAEAALAAVEAHGGALEASYSGWLQALVPAEALLPLAEEDSVALVRRPLWLQPQATASEGSGTVGATTWQQAGFTGKGVKVGVIDSFSSYEALLGSELPPSVVFRSFTSPFADRSRHGVAVSEVIHDIAPNAQLYLAEIRTEIEFARAVDWLIEQDIDIINMSGGFPGGGAGDGTGPINSIVDEAAAQGILWVNAAGNEALGHWAGTPYDPDADGLHNFSGADEVNNFILPLPAGAVIEIILKWDDPWDAPCNDLDLALILQTSRGPVSTAMVADTQDCKSGHPVEDLIATAPVTGFYGVGVNFFALSGRPLRLELLVDGPPLEYSSPDGSISGTIPADNKSVLAVGAVPYSTPSTIEPFSSRGTTRDGRTKPDLVAPDRVSTVAFSPQAFAGTSAAAPHVAGAAALVKQANPTWTARQIWDFLEQRAVDLGPPGKDNTYGAGRLALGSPPPGGPPPSALLIVQQLASIEGKYEAVFTFDAASQSWLYYLPGAGGTLQALEVGKGYFIFMKQGATLTYGGRSWALVAGWNLIGFY